MVASAVCAVCSCSAYLQLNHKGQGKRLALNHKGETMKNLNAAKREANARNKNQKPADGRVWKVADVRGSWKVVLVWK